MVKVLLFFGLVLGVMFYPMAIASKESKKTALKSVTLPDVVFKNGRFYIYEGKLAKTGEFSDFKMYNKGYVLTDLHLSDLIKNEEYRAHKTVLKDDNATGYKVWYKNKDLELSTKTAYYNKKTKILKGGTFKLLSDDFKGEGESFEVDDKKDLYARKITYYLKVKE